MDPWLLSWSSPFQTHGYEPVPLGNGTFGGLLDLSGVTMDLWSSQVGVIPTGSGDAIKLPMAFLRTRAFFQTPHFGKTGFWLGSTGIFGPDPRYLNDPSMPPIVQSYDNRQTLDLRAGVARTSGTLYPGSQAAWENNLAPERVVPFRTEVAFLKDSPELGLRITTTAENRILFAPEPILRERLRLGSEGKGIHRLGNAIDCDLLLEQTLGEVRAEDGRIVFEILPRGATPFRMFIESPGTRLTTFQGHPAFEAVGRAFFRVSLVLDGSCRPAAPPAPDAFFAEQRRRWDAFWSAGSVSIPDPLWQQRYHASQFQVAQSLGDGPTHPGGLSKPMLPYWTGCFHDTDTYFCRPLLESGRASQALRHLAFRHRTLPAARANARKIGRSGALYPWCCDPDGNGSTHDVPINGAIIACEAWHHFAYSRTPESLAYAADIVGQSLDNLADHLDLDSSPLRFREKPLMTFSETVSDTDPPEVRIALRAVADAWLNILQARGKDDLPRRLLAERILAELEIPRRPDGSFGKEEEPEYLRCPSITLGSFPLHHLEAGPALQAVFERELARILFVFAWLPHHASVVASQLKICEGSTSAAALLRQADAFYKPWHAMDEWENRRSVRAAVFVTGAGGFCTAIHHLLLAETADRVWTLFPGTPAEWGDVQFVNLHTRAGWKISARRAAGKTTEFHATPTHPQSDPEFHVEIPNPSEQLWQQWQASCGARRAGTSLFLRLSARTTVPASADSEPWHATKAVQPTDVKGGGA